MNILRRLISGLLSLALTTLIGLWSLTTIFSSSAGLNQIISQSGVYTLFAQQAIQSLSSAQSLPANYQTIFTASLQKTVTQQRVESAFAPILVDIVSWLNQPDTTPPPVLILNLSELKSAFIADVKTSSLKPAELSQVEAQVSQAIPTQLDITQVNQLFGTPSTATPTLDIMSSLKQFKTYLNLARIVSFWLTILAILLTVVIVWLSRYDGRLILRRPAWIYASASFFTLIGWAILSYLYRPSNADPTNQAALLTQTLTDLTRAVLDIAKWYAFGLLLIAIILYGLSFLIRPGNRQAFKPALPLNKR
ncbi:hypothetical protein KBC99_01040 [Candidatus Saccharibacteria bacterium]|nr:hypothetical protein [Candidatus Saccharibacteria bacterium]